MEKKQNKGRWFLIQHKCGAEFTINTANIIESFDKGDPFFKCPGCFKSISDKIQKELRNFCADYTRVINAFNEQDFQIREKITDEDSGS